MEHLNYDEFMAKFSELWEFSKESLFKLEMLPEYDEFNVDNWKNVDARQAEKLVHRVQNEILSYKESDAQKYLTGFKSIRVRYLPFPVSKYLFIELSSYATSQYIGEIISIIDDSTLANIPANRIPYFCDYLLFDDCRLLKLNNLNGIVKCSAFYSEEKYEIEPYLELKNLILTLSEKLDDYMSRYNLSFINKFPVGTD